MLKRVLPWMGMFGRKETHHEVAWKNRASANLRANRTNHDPTSKAWETLFTSGPIIKQF